MIGKNPDLDRQALDTDPDPAKWCGSDRIRIRNTVYNNTCGSTIKSKKTLTALQDAGALPTEQRHIPPRLLSDKIDQEETRL